MEGHRWFDICRWGIAKEIMDAYKATETPECQAQMAEFIKGKHELLPISSKEIELNPMAQNIGYSTIFPINTNYHLIKQPYEAKTFLLSSSTCYNGIIYRLLQRQSI